MLSFPFRGDGVASGARLEPRYRPQLVSWWPLTSTEPETPQSREQRRDSLFLMGRRSPAWAERWSFRQGASVAVGGISCSARCASVRESGSPQTSERPVISQPASLQLRPACRHRRHARHHSSPLRRSSGCSRPGQPSRPPAPCLGSRLCRR